MKLKEHTKYIKILWCVLVVLLLGLLAISFAMTKNMILIGMLAVAFVGVGVLFYLQYHLDDQYISSVVNDLSLLCENLIELKETTVFEENEDTLLSKLQNRILKLAGILKMKNKESLKKQEDMKALVSDISHQLKTPLANLNMYIDFLEDDSINAI